jgi:hypothetical protein
MDRVEARSIRPAIEISVTLQEMIELAFPLMQKCAATTALNAVQSPVQDAAQGWLIARDAILITFATNWDSMRRGLRIDVKYPSGDIVRFVTLTIQQGADLSSRNVTIVKFGDGIPGASSPSPCR